MIKKELYATPATEVLELRLEGVIATSDPVGASFGDSNKFGGFDDEPEPGV